MTLLGWILGKLGAVIDEVAIVEVPQEVSELGRVEGARLHISFAVSVPVGRRAGRWFADGPTEIQ